MANSIQYKDKPFCIGDTLTVSYRIKEGDKERQQAFKGILIKIKGDTEENRMITVRKVANDGTGVERIIPLSSPYIVSIKLDKKTDFTKAKLYFIRKLSDQKLRNKLYSKKSSVVKH